MTGLLSLNEATFGQQVLHPAAPTLVLFGSRACPASRALAPLLAQAAAGHTGQLRAARISVEAAGLLAEQYGVQATPTLLLFEGGEPRIAAVGFLMAGLLRVLCEQIAGGTLPPGGLWSPLEEVFEDAVMAPLLDLGGLAYRRQAACAAPGGPSQRRRRVDFLVSERDGSPPFTLIESKRRIGAPRDLQRAAEQARGYAQAHALSTFAVAAPAGMWFYRHPGARPLCVHALTSLEIHQRPEAVAHLLRSLA